MAYTKDVNRKGRVTQNHSGRITRKAIHATSEIKNASQYFEVEFVSVLIVFLCAANLK